MENSRKAEADRLLERGDKQNESSRFESALSFCQQALAIYREISDRAGEGAALNSLGNAYSGLGNYAKAIEFFEQSLIIARSIGVRIGEERCLSNLGNAYCHQGNYAKAIDYHQQSLVIARSIGDHLGEEAALKGLGDAYLFLNDYAKAIEFLEQSLVIARSIGVRIGEERCLYNLGLAYRNQGNYAKAINYYQQSLAIARSVGDRTGEGRCLNSLGNTYLSLTNYAKAIEVLEQSLVIARSINNRAGEGDALHNLGIAYRNQGDYAKAIEFLEQSLVIARSIGNRTGEERCLCNLGLACRNQGNYAKAIDYHQQSLAIARSVGDRTGEGAALNGLGSAYLSLSDYAKAIEFLEQSLVIARSINKRAEEGNALNNLGIAYRSQGDYAKAIDCFEQHLVIVRAIGNRAGEGAALNNLGDAHLSLGDYAKAIEFYEQHLVIVRAIGNRAGEEAALGSLGNAYLFLGDYAKAIEFYEQSLTIAQSIGNRAGEGNSLGSLGNAYCYLDNYAKAIEFYEQSLTIVQSIGNRAGEGAALNGLGSAYLSLSNYAKAIEFYEQGLAIASSIGDRVIEGNSLGNLGKVYSSWGKYAQAIDYHQQQLIIARSIGDRAGEGRCLSNLGADLLNSGQLAEAERILRDGIGVWESIRGRLGSNDYFKVSIFETQVNAYLDLQKVLIMQHKPEDALEIAERGRARAFMELLALRLFASPNAIPNIDPPSVAHIQQIASAQNATLVEYSTISSEELFIWVIQPTSQITFRRVDLNSLHTPLFELVLDSRQSIGIRSRDHTSTLAIAPGDLVKLNDDLPDWEPWQVVAVDPLNSILSLWQSSLPEGLTIPRPITDVVALVESRRTNHSCFQQLHQLLIEPIADLLPSDPEARVIFIPQHILFLVPFGALQDAQGKYLIEKHTILTAPAIQVLELTRQKRLQVGGNAKDILVIGNPTMPKVSLVPGDPSKPLALLPHAEREAQAIAQLFQTQALIGDSATKAAIVQQLPNARIIHLATHGLLDNIRGIGSAVALAPCGKDNGLLTAEEILELNLNAELVVLSACNTGMGRLTGDGVIGLSRSLISAGTLSVIVSLWAVPDAPTADLMMEFYQNFQRTGDKAQALRQAMLTTMQQHPNPRDWAAFTLIGEANLPESLNCQQEAANESTSPLRLIELARVSTDLARLVANNPNAPGNLLGELSASNDATTRARVAANPNTPTEVLLQLGGEFSEQLLGNPIFSLLLLENPNLVDKIPLTTLRSILKHETVPVSFLEWAANHSDLEVKLAVATNAQTPKAALEKLVQNHKVLSAETSQPYVNTSGELVQSLKLQVSEALRLHVNCAGEMASGWDEAAREVIQTMSLQVYQELDREYALLELQKIGLIPGFVIKHFCVTKHVFYVCRHLSSEVHSLYKVLLEAAKSAHTPPTVFEQFARDEKLRNAIAWNPNTPANLFEELARDEMADVCKNVALSPYTPIRILEQLAQDNDAEVRKNVAWNFKTPAEVLDQLTGQLAQLNYSYLHTLEVNAYKTPFTVIEQMARDKRSEVRKDVAKYRNTPAKILEQLAQDEDARVRRMAALNVNTPFRVLLGQLAHDADVGVRSAVAIRFNAIAASPFSRLSATDIPQILSSLGEAEEYQGAAHQNSNGMSINPFLTENSKALESLLEKLARHEDSSARRFIAQLPDTPLNLLKELAFDKEVGVRKGVAANQNAPGSILEQLAHDEQDQIRCCVAKHPNTPASILEQLFSDLKSRVRRVAVTHYLAQNSEGLPTVLEHYAKNALPFFPRLLILLHPKTPTGVLVQHCRSTAWLERYAIAQNPNTPLNTLSALVKDANRIVRASARTNLQSRSQ